MKIPNIKYLLLINYARFIYTGVQKDNRKEMNLKIMFINRLMIIFLINITFFLLLYLSISYYKSSFYSLVVLLLSFAIYKFYTKRKYLNAKIYMLMYLNLIVFLSSIYFYNPLLCYNYIPIIIASTMIFSFKELKYLILLNILSCTLMFIQITSLNEYLPRIYTDETPEKSNFIFASQSISFTLCIVFMYLYYKNTKARNLIRINEKLKESKIRLKKQSRSYLMFSEASNHFLKSPIYNFNSYIGKIESGIDEGKSYQEMKHYFAKIKHSIDEEEKFINNMFDYNKIILTRPKKMEVDIIQKINESLKKFSLEKPDFDYKITESNTSLYVITDPDLLEKIILNITENAYLYNNKPIKKLEISFQKIKNQVKINFKDNGIGIDNKYREKIFKPYIRLNTIENVRGTGIGLLKARKAAELINSKLVLLESSSNGSTFQLTANLFFLD